jgi:hypothetical protein
MQSQHLRESEGWPRVAYHRLTFWCATVTRVMQVFLQLPLTRGLLPYTGIKEPRLLAQRLKEEAHSRP